MPKASAANAPWVLVCESPQTTVIPAASRRAPGDDVDDAWRLSRNGKYALAPVAPMLASSVSTCVREIDAMPCSQSRVGVL